MRYTILLLLCSSFSVFCQEVPIIESVIGKTYDFSTQRQIQWNDCIQKMTNPISEEKTPEEHFVEMEKCSDIGASEACEDIWSIVCGDHWTDEGYAYRTIDLSKSGEFKSYKDLPSDYKFNSVSSALPSQGKNKYGSNSVSDLSYKTARVEGVKGDGIGEWTLFEFPMFNPRINEVIIANGYIKDKKIWKNNSRVKQLKMYLNNVLFAILNLQDVYAEQSFKVPTIGTKYDPNKIYETYYTKEGVLINGRDNTIIPEMKIRFEISAVYKGDKYQDTAITEIYFNGLDVY